MNTILKLLFFTATGALILLAGVYLYRKLNERVQNSETSWQLLGNSLLLFLALSLLYSGGVYLLILLYSYFKEESAGPASHSITA